MKINYLQQLLLLGVIVVVFMTIYATAQQVLRASANDPQIQMAEDAANQIAAGVIPASIVPSVTVDISKSLATFYIVYDKNGKIIDSSARLSGQTPTLPSGVFDSSKSSGLDKFTWQPASDARLATVVVPVSGGKDGYVLVGRSLKQVEIRENHIELLSFGGLLASIILLLLASFSRRFADS
jgi:hypothetical protein